MLEAFEPQVSSARCIRMMEVTRGKARSPIDGPAMRQHKNELAGIFDFEYILTEARGFNSSPAARCRGIFDLSQEKDIGIDRRIPCGTRHSRSETDLRKKRLFLSASKSPR
jgi:hypothetical protein